MGATATNVHAGLGAQHQEIISPRMHRSFHDALAAQNVHGGNLTIVHTPGDHVVRGMHGNRDMTNEGFISLGAGESVRDGTHDIKDAKNGLKIAAAIVFTAISAGTIGYLVDDMWFRNRLISPWGGAYGGGYGYGMGGW